MLGQRRREVSKNWSGMVSSAAVVDSNALLSRQISGRAGDSVAFELLLLCI
jgi:hypothetical protein